MRSPFFVFKVDTGNNDENKVTISDSYYTGASVPVVEIDADENVWFKNVIKPVNSSSFINFDYDSKYENGKTWCEPQ